MEHTTSFGSRDVERRLEFGVQNIKETVCETPQEEENCHKCDGQNGLLYSQCRRASETRVGNGFLMCIDFGVGRSTLVQDLRWSGLFTLAEHLVGYALLEAGLGLEKMRMAERQTQEVDSTLDEN